jgi:hypothetical protein
MKEREKIFEFWIKVEIGGGVSNKEEKTFATCLADFASHVGVLSSSCKP